MWLKGIDVSQCQRSIDWDKVAGAGFRFAIVKCTEGAHYRDPMRLDHLNGAKAAGLLDGVYHFARPSRSLEDARAQFRALWDALPGTMPALRFVLDLETTGGLDGRAVLDWAAAWCEEARLYWPIGPVLYTGKYFLQTLATPATNYPELTACDLHLAQYSQDRPWEPVEGRDAPAVPAGWTTWKFWQYSGDHGAPVPGVVGACDRNVFNGDEAELRRWRGIVDPEAPTRPELPILTEDVVDWAEAARRKARGEGS